MGTGEALCPSYGLRATGLRRMGKAKRAHRPNRYQGMPLLPMLGGDGHGRGPLPILRATGLRRVPIGPIAIDQDMPLSTMLGADAIAMEGCRLGIFRNMEYRRCYWPGGLYFFTVVTEQRRPLLVEHVDRLRGAFRHAMERHPFEIEGIVVLPDHLHTIWHLPEAEADFSVRWMVIKRKFSAGLPLATTNASKRHKREKGIWQRRFWEHCIRDQADWQRHMDYIHYNPVKHGYCASPGDWPYSSFRRSVERGLYRPDWGADVSPAPDLDLE